MYTVLTSRWPPSSLLAGEGHGRGVPCAPVHTAHIPGPAITAQRIRRHRGNAVVAVAPNRVRPGSGGSDGRLLVSDCVQRSPKAGIPRPDFQALRGSRVAPCARPGVLPACGLLLFNLLLAPACTVPFAFLSWWGFCSRFLRVSPLETGLSRVGQR